ncbi:hypothetical protein QBC35DRAFT_481481 [Podospora australis]|uniref:Uncharacterized protein n=1 Tax=Podospora australis TaxID=1536484 RepID=A0AAN6X5R3_9PEZI|nr:hypothetical protein QBC35DRAFT_481481 [Podospora australis]
MVLAWYQARLASRPLLTQAITTSILFAVGDITAQQLVERKSSSSLPSSPSSPSSLEPPVASHDFTRTARMALYGGAIFGPAAATWFKFLSRKVNFPSSPRKTMLARVAVDQGVFAPTFIGIFLSSMAVLEGGSPKEKLEKNYWPALSTNYLIWPWVQMVNFTFVPLQHRVLFVNVISIGWNCYLSYLNSS